MFSKQLLVAAVLGLGAMYANADNVLIVHGLSTTSEPATTQQNIDHWPVVCNAQSQHTVTYVDTPPADLSAYRQIWDIRFSNSSPLTTADQASYTAALAAGASLFVMGEHSGFPTRNASISNLVNQLGGGQLTTTTGFSAVETVHAPLNGNGLSTVTYSAGGLTQATGLTGVLTTETGTTGEGTSFLWPRGTLSAAPLGKLSVVFDVNFMMTSNANSGNNGQLLANLCEQLSVPVEPAVVQPVPANGPLGLGLLALAILGLAAFKRRVFQ